MKIMCLHILNYIYIALRTTPSMEINPLHKPKRHKRLVYGACPRLRPCSPKINVNSAAFYSLSVQKEWALAN